MRIASYSIELIPLSDKPQDTCVGIKRYAYGTYDTFLAMDFKEAVDYLTIKIPDVKFSIVWNMDKFWKILSSLLPQSTQETATKTNKAFFDNVKIYYVGRMLGLTRQDVVVKDMKDKLEVNIFPLNSWLSETREEPDVKELASLGEQVLDAMDTLGIPVTTLTSPAGLYSKHLVGKVPTVYSSPAIKDACNACLEVMNLEWVQKYQSEMFAPVFTNDLASAYPSFMCLLPNTDKCKITHSKDVVPSHWAIVKIDALCGVPEINPLVTVEREWYASPELAWIKKHGGSFNVLDGYYFQWLDKCHPYEQPIKKLWEARQLGSIVGESAKRMMNGISGKTSQQNNDGSFGELYNPIYSTMTLTNCRLECANFIEQNKLESVLVEVHVDAVKSYRNLMLPNKVDMGQWRSQ